jgi:hypothetical protein
MATAVQPQWRLMAFGLAPANANPFASSVIRCRKLLQSLVAGKLSIQLKNG